uniref:Uncharacterized protein n=1 Tax=Oryza punctata TaxID=4537 RepID=A0A0E0L2K3_ORYPU
MVELAITNTSTIGGIFCSPAGSSSSGFTSSAGKCTTTFTPASTGKPWVLPLMTWSSSISVTILWNASFRMAFPSAYLLPSAVILSSLLTCSVCPPLLAVAGIGHTSTTLPSSAATAQETTTTISSSSLRTIADAIPARNRPAASNRRRGDR